MKTKKILFAVGFSVIQIVLLLFWAIVLIETICPVYKWPSALGLVPQNITVCAPERVESFLTPSSEKCNNQKFTYANSLISSCFVTEYNLSAPPQHRVLQNSRNTFVYELYSDEQPHIWRVSVYFGVENSFDIFVDETAGGTE